VIYNYYANYAPTGIANRISIASAMGVAIVVVTVAATLDWSLRARFRRTVTLTLVSAFCALGIFMNATIGVLWVEAATIQETVFATLAATLPRVPDGASVMLFGQCPYHGPATVYTSSWDLQGRLQLDIGLSHVRADIITEDSTIGPEGLTNREYDLTATYPFGELYVFDSRAGDVTRLADLAAATAYFAARPIDHATGCAFRDGEGQRLF
jgi:hypothetical protein